MTRLSKYSRMHNNQCLSDQQAHNQRLTNKQDLLDIAAGAIFVVDLFLIAQIASELCGMPCVLDVLFKTF